MILSGNAIRERLNDGPIFRESIWDESSIKEPAKLSESLRTA